MGYISLKGNEHISVCSRCVFKDHYTQCKHPESIQIDIISGDKWGQDCKNMRSKGWPCGPEGELFVAKK